MMTNSRRALDNELRIILGDMSSADLNAAADKIVADATAWQAQAQAAGVSTNVAASGQPAGSDSVNATIASVAAAGTAATTAGQAALALYQQMQTAAQNAAMMAQYQQPGVAAPTTQSTAPPQDLQTNGQAAVTAGQAATTAANVGKAMAPGASASAWLAQASTVTNAANAAAAAANTSLTNAQALQTQQAAMTAAMPPAPFTDPNAAAAAAYGGGGGGYGGGGGGSGGGGISEDDVDWGDGSAPGGGEAGGDMFADAGFGGGSADGIDWGDSGDSSSTSAQDDIDFVNEGLPDGTQQVVGDSLWMEIIGAYDIAAKQEQMNGLKTVSIAVARALLKGGQQAINTAIVQSVQPWYKSDLPGQTSRKNVQDHLQWHETELSKYASKDPNATLYPNADDLKKWTMQAFIEANAVEEGAAYLDAAWTAMWIEIGHALAALPKQVAAFAGGVVDTAVRTATGGMPLWGVAAIVVGAAGLLGYGVYKIAVSPTGTAILGGASRGYFGRSR